MREGYFPAKRVADHESGGAAGKLRLQEPCQVSGRGLYSVRTLQPWKKD